MAVINLVMEAMGTTWSAFFTSKSFDVMASTTNAILDFTIVRDFAFRVDEGSLFTASRDPKFGGGESVLFAVSRDCEFWTEKEFLVARLDERRRE
jgi:hypothetical protein